MSEPVMQVKNLGSYLVILAVAVVFILEFGPSSHACDAPLSKQQSDLAAEVNGQDISRREFRTVYAQRAAAEGLNDTNAALYLPPQGVLDWMVARKLLEQQTATAGIAAADSQVLSLLTKNPDFQVDGKFDFTRYSEIVRQNYGNTLPGYEDSLRRQLSGDELIALVIRAPAPSEDEVYARYLHGADKASATVVRFMPTMFADKVAAPTPAKIQAFEGEHAQEIASYYNQNKQTYQVGERVHARQILVGVKPDASPEEKAAARQKAEQLRSLIVDGKKDFGGVARQSSDDAFSKARGGDLGTQERSSLPTEFANAAFALQPGEISQPVETNLGFRLIQVLEKKPAQTRTLDQARDEIAAVLLRRQEAQALARAEAEKALAKLKAGKDLAALYPSKKSAGGESPFEVALHPEATETGDFSAGGDAIPMVGRAPELARDIFASTGPRKLDRLYPVADGFVLAEVTKRERPSPADFDQQRAKLRDELATQRGNDAVESYARALRKVGNVKVNPDVIAPKMDQS